MVLAEAGKYPEASRMLERSIEMRPTQYRAWGLLASVYRNQHADEAKVREHVSQSHRAVAATCGRKRRGIHYLLADVGSYYAALGMEAESVPLLASGGGARAGRIRKCSIRWPSATKRFTAVRRRCNGLQRRERVAMLPEPSRGILSCRIFTPTRDIRRPSATVGRIH